MPGRNGDYIYSTMLGDSLPNTCGLAYYRITVREFCGLALIVGAEAPGLWTRRLFRNSSRLPIAMATVFDLTQLAQPVQFDLLLVLPAYRKRQWVPFPPF
jgi:hypothetical protein